MPSPKRRRCRYDHEETQWQSAAMSSQAEEEHLQFRFARHSRSVGGKKTTPFGFGENSKQQKTPVLKDAEIGRICKHARATTGGLLQKSCMNNEFQQQTWAGNRNLCCKNTRKSGPFPLELFCWYRRYRQSYNTLAVHLFKCNYSNRHVF